MGGHQFFGVGRPREQQAIKPLDSSVDRWRRRQSPAALMMPAAAVCGKPWFMKNNACCGTLVTSRCGLLLSGLGKSNERSKPGRFRRSIEE